MKTQKTPLNKEKVLNAFSDLKDFLVETVWHCPCCDKKLGKHEDDCILYILTDYFEDIEKENGNE